MTELNNFKFFFNLYFQYYKITISILVAFCILGIIFQYNIIQKEKYYFSVTKEINEVYYANFYTDFGIENELFLNYFNNFYKLFYIELLNKENKLDSYFENSKELKESFMKNLKISFQPQRIIISAQFNDQNLFENRIFIQNALHTYISISLENLIVQVAEKLIKRLDFQITFLDEFISSQNFLNKDSNIDEITIMKYRLNSEYNFDHWLKTYAGFLPSRNMRWCTRMLKIKPFEVIFRGESASDVQKIVARPKHVVFNFS